MEIKKRIKPNGELYGDFTPLPIPLEPIQQRIDFFEKKVEVALASNNGDDLHKYHKAWTHWKGIKDEHCELDV